MKFDKYDNDSLINYANRILENFNKGDYHTETESKGRNSQPLYQLYYTLSQLTNIYNQIYDEDIIKALEVRFRQTSRAFLCD